MKKRHRNDCVSKSTRVRSSDPCRIRAGAAYFGARTLEDLSWKQLFDGLSCTECGRCNDNCPAAMSGKPLQPMNIIVDIKHHMEDQFKAGGRRDLSIEDTLTPPMRITQTFMVMYNMSCVHGGLSRW